MYVMMYVMEYITITEFRKNTKVILDAAENGPVMLRRGDELYELKKFGNVLHTNTVSSNVRPDIAPINIGAPDFGEAAIENMKPEKPQLRTPRDVLKEIDSYKAELKERLEYCQDPDAKAEIEKEGKDTLDALWAEWNQLKESGPFSESKL